MTLRVFAAWGGVFRLYLWGSGSVLWVDERLNCCNRIIWVLCAVTCTLR
jgi:hypothetical protein